MLAGNAELGGARTEGGVGATWVEVAQRAGGRGMGDAESGWRVRTSDARVRAFQKYFSNINLMVFFKHHEFVVYI